MKMRFLVLARGVTLGIALSVPGAVALAGGLTDAIMAPGLFGSAAEGELFRYSHDRQIPGRPAGTDAPGAAKGLPVPGPVIDGMAVLSLDPAEGLVLSLADQEHPEQSAADFPPGSPNPVLMFFLENVVRNMAAQTGGSPFYIRNRIRDALAAETGPAPGGGVQRITLHPFAGDANAARMGDFAGLTVTLAYDPDRPDRLVELLADTGDGPGGYSESLKLLPEG